MAKKAKSKKNVTKTVDTVKEQIANEGVKTEKVVKKAVKKTDKKEKRNSKAKRHFWKDFKAELKKVVWPTPKQLINSTAAVITIAIITAVIVVVLDLGFEALNKFGINGVKNLVNNQVSDSQVENTQGEEPVDTDNEENSVQE